MSDEQQITNVYIRPVYVTVSGVSQDEMLWLEGYRAVKQQQGGSIYFEMQEGRAVKWDVRPNIGNCQALNTALGKRKLKD